MNEKYLENDNHWTAAPYPLRPCTEEVEIYKNNLLSGKTLLLGCTTPLLDICDEAIDLVVRVQNPKIRQGDWYNISGFYDNIITDGAINLTGPSLIDAVKPHCKQLISRVFSRKFSYMKYAKLFYTEFPNATKIAEINESCPIFIWKFTS
jgi:hypothetical protein